MTQGFIPQNVHGAHVVGLQFEKVPQRVRRGQHRIYACPGLDVAARLRGELVAAPAYLLKGDDLSQSLNRVDRMGAQIA